ncbi:C40 family peptidase [Holdemanella biformis]|uniref:C40 family peptidase n=1 Tax=Holdemanella biformis TaxID=1735 RepID=UPI001C37FE2C|nr:NlpC/P60 family protein [Holdemanella biformis]MBV4130014.1 C40 family peptidase [Holdemanella biformis]MBV4149759.1 C40 family peptidase [Holdemanella biformis]
MNFVENNGKKVAAILCVASAFPVVATVVAAKEEPGWHGDRYVNEDKTVAKGWQEIEGKSYYFSEDGTVNSSKTEKATTASVSSNITGEVKETVTTASQEAVKQETEEKAVVEETPVQTEEVKTETTETTTDTTETPEAPVAPVETPSVDTTTQTPEQDPTPAPEAPAAPVETPSVDTTTQAPEQNTTPAPAAPEQTPEQNPTPAPETPAAPEQTPEQNPTPAPEQTPAPAPEETVTPAPEQTASSLGDRISSSAQELVGVTDGLWCTQVVQQALANAGVSDAYQLWPDQYQGVYGYYTDSPLAGDLIYYNNGGRGVDHIAVYIGNGQAVHGNYNGKTVIADAYQSGMGNPQYIRVVR